MSGPKKILVVDDNVDIAELVCAAAESASMDCTVAITMAELLAGLTGDPDLILLDLKMPEMSGREVLELLAGLKCRAEIVLMSGHGDAVLSQKKAYGAGLGLQMAGTLPKPFRMPELLTVLRG